MSNNIDSAKLDKSVLEVVSLNDVPSDKEFWQSKTPQERLAAVELMRQINYGYDPATIRLQRVLEIAQLKRS